MSSATASDESARLYPHRADDTPLHQQLSGLARLLHDQGATAIAALVYGDAEVLRDASQDLGVTMSGLHARLRTIAVTALTLARTISENGLLDQAGTAGESGRRTR